MKNILFILSVFALVSFDTFAQPSNDECSGAFDLGTLAAPGSCGSGLQEGAKFTIIGATNVAATPENPYVVLSGCGMSSPANSVWYSFTVPVNGYGVEIEITNAAFDTPNIALWQLGVDCSELSGQGCNVGAGGTASLTIPAGIIPGETYIIQVSGDTGDEGTFDLSVNSFQDCSDCNRASTLSMTPLPTNGSYSAGETINFCYHIDSWTNVNTNWLHGVQLAFGDGWDLSTLTTTPPPSWGNCSDCTWDYYSAGITDGDGTVWPPGFYYDGNSARGPGSSDGNPGNNFGDPGSSGANGATLTPGASDWLFCFSITVKEGCNPGMNLNVDVTTSGDGESGAWSSSGCGGDDPSSFNAFIGCCPPDMTVLPSCTGGAAGSSTASPVGTEGPWTFQWDDPSAQTTSTATNLTPGDYTVTVIDKNSCAAQAFVTVVSLIAPVTTASTLDSPLCLGDCADLAGTNALGQNFQDQTFTNSLSVAIPDEDGVTGANSSITSTGIFNTTLSGTMLQSICFEISHPSASDIGATVKGAATPDAITITVNGNTYNYTPLPLTDGATTLCFPASVIAAINAAGGASNTTWVIHIEDNKKNNTGTLIDWEVVIRDPNSIDSFEWDPTTLMTPSDNSSLTPSVCPTTTTTYTLTTYDLFGCQSSADVEVVVAFNPTTASVNPTCATATDGSVSATGVGGLAPYEYAWEDNLGSPLLTETLADGVTSTLSSVGNGTYTCVITDDNGCEISVDVTINSTASCGCLNTGTLSGDVEYCINSCTDLTFTFTGSGPWDFEYTTQVLPAAASAPIALSTSPLSAGLVDQGSGVFTYEVCPTESTIYTLTSVFDQTEACNGANQGTATITVNPLPTITGNLIVCGTSSTTLSGSGIPAAVDPWLSASTGVATVNSSGVVTGVSPGTSVITYTDDNGCENTATVTVKALPTIGGTLSVCLPLPATSQLTGSGTPAVTDPWLSSNTGVATVSGTGLVTAVSTGSTTITYEDVDGCQQTALFSVNPQPTITGTLSVCINATTLLTGSGTPDGSTPWSSSDPTKATVSSTGLVTGVAAGTSTITYTNSNGCQQTATITVNALPTTGGPTTVCVGSDIQLTGSATAHATTAWAVAAGTGTASITSGGLLTGLTAGTVTVTYMNTNGCTVDATITVNALPTTGGPTTVCIGSDIQLTGSATAHATTPWAVAAGTGTASITSGGLLTGLTAGIVTVTYMNTNGCAVDAIITVNALPITGGPTTVCIGSDIQLTGSATAHATTPWAVAAGTGTATITSGGLLTGTSVGDVTVTYMNTNGCEQTATVTVNALPTIGGTLAVCLNEDTQLTGSATAHATTPWSVAAGTGTATITSGGLLTGTSVGDVTVTYMNTNGCEQTATITIVANPIPDSEVTTVCETVPSSGISNGVDVTSYSMTITSTGSVVWYTSNTYGVVDTPTSEDVSDGDIFYYELTENGCVYQGEFVINVEDNIVPADIVDDLCEDNFGVGTIANLDLTAYENSIFSGGSAYTWTGGDVQNVSTDPQVFTVMVSSTGCSDAPGTVTINVISQVDPAFTQIGPICTGTSVTLPTISDNGISGTWSPAIDNTQTTTYTFIPDVDECATTTSMEIVVTDAVTPVFALGPICYGDENFTLPSISDNSITGTWSPAFDNTQTGTYTFTPDSDPCAVAVDVEVVVNEVRALFDATPEDGVVPLVVQFTNLSTSSTIGSVLTYSWVFGDGNTSTLENPSNTYNDLGLFTAELFVEDEIGCRDSISIDIETMGGSTVELPNVFTPGGGDANDFFKPRSENMGMERLQIFNRWGQLLFDENEVGVQWDGTNLKGEDVPDGTYYYIYYGEGASDGKVYDSRDKETDICEGGCNGHLTLLRSK